MTDVQMPPRLTVDTLSAPLHAMGARDEVTVDLTEVSFIELSGMTTLLAAIAWRSRRKYPTRVRNSRFSTVRDYLQSWRFFEALPVWSQAAIDELLTRETQIVLDARSRSEVRSRYDRYDNSTVGKTAGALFSDEHFPLFDIQIDGDELHAAVKERAHWLKPTLQSILSNTIGENASELIAGTVIFEGVKNTSMHPDATCVYTAAQLERDRDNRPTGFTLCIWDDGQSISSSLRKGFRRHRKITNVAFNHEREEFVVHHWTRRSEGAWVDSGTYPVTTDFPPDMDSELSLLIGAFFRGVTAIPGIRPDDQLPTKRLSDRAATWGGAGLEFYGGLGLFFIREAIAYESRGRVEYTTGRYRLRITFDQELEQYVFDVFESSTSAAAVHGNLLTVHVPHEPSKLNADADAG